jgi:hypothetical protein
MAKFGEKVGKRSTSRSVQDCKTQIKDLASKPTIESLNRAKSAQYPQDGEGFMAE